MSRRAVGVVLAALVAVGVGTGPVGVETASAAPPAHTLKVSGAGVDSYPAFDPGTERYAVTTTAATAGSVTVDATTSDPSGRVLVDGRDETGHPVTVTGLSAGEEVSVIFEDSAGAEAHSLVYLPAGFPALKTVTKQPGIAPGLVALTLTQWNQPTANFETVVDDNGVPVYVRTSTDSALDLKLQPNGHVSVSRKTTTPGRTGSAVAELDAAFREVGRYETEGLVNTDDSDSVLLANGHRILVAQEPNATTGLVDAVIQELSESGAKLFEWNSGAHGLAAETMVAAGNKDYAHIDSVVVMPDGDLLASFRHLSAVLKIARTAHDGFQVGDIVWRLGGRHSSFTFPDDQQPTGPCAQHSASVLPNGHILVFDNGSGGIDIPLCVDPANPAGPAVDRRFSRVTEYDVSQPGVAHLVWSYLPPGGRYNFFAGSAQRLANGNTLVGYATIRGAVATEVDATGTAVWELKDATAVDPQPYYSTYRAVKFSVPDALEPVVTVVGAARRRHRRRRHDRHPRGPVHRPRRLVPAVLLGDRADRRPPRHRDARLAHLVGDRAGRRRQRHVRDAPLHRGGCRGAGAAGRRDPAPGRRLDRQRRVRRPEPSDRAPTRHPRRDGRGRRTPPERRHHRRPAPGPRHGGQPCLPGDLPGGGTRRQPGGPAGDLPHGPPGTRTLRPGPGPGDRHPGGPRRRRAHRARPRRLPGDTLPGRRGGAAGPPLT